MELTIICPNCKSRINVKYGKNRWVEWFEGYCQTCGYRFMLKDKDFDVIQPDSPFFEPIYRFRPEKEAVKREKIKNWEKEQKKAKLEEKYHKMTKEGKLKPWELKSLKRITLEESEY